MARHVYTELPFYQDPADGYYKEGPFEDSVVETAGYMSARQQIERLIAAGTINAAWKKAHFPPETDVPEDFVPPDYAPSELDIIDEARAVIAGKTRAQARKDAYEKAKLEETQDEVVVPDEVPEPDPAA